VLSPKRTEPGSKQKETSFSKERRIFEDGKFFTEDGRARFLFDPPREMPEKPDDEYPFLLLTGRGTSLQWHTNKLTFPAFDPHSRQPSYKASAVRISASDR